MALTPCSPFLRHIRHLIGSDPATRLSDQQLLERFLAQRDETAVEVLVRRYGPLVFGVCRRVLQNTHAAEDAFQATFLVLMRKAPSLGCYPTLGGFLYRVAFRLALRARANEARQRQCETEAARCRPPADGRVRSVDERIVALEEELQRLPERHRAPLVLCYLEGKTNEQAAQVLGCPPGSMSARLAQARERLRACLAKRGYAVPVTGIAALLASTTAHAAVPLPLLDNTVRAAVWFAGAEAGAAGFVSTQAVALARGACGALLVNKLKIAAAVLLAAAMLGTGATLLLKASPPADPPAQAPPSRADAAGEQLPQGAIARMGSTQLRNGDAVSVAAYTPDGTRLLTTGRDKTVRLWDLATGKEVRRFDWGQLPPDSKPEPTEDGVAWKKEQQFWDETARSCTASLSRDGKLVAASRGGIVCLWDAASGTKLRQLQTGQKRLIQLAFSADGKSLLTLGPGQATAVWEVATGRCVQRSPGEPAQVVLAPIQAIYRETALVSPGLKYLAYWKRDAKDSSMTSIYIRDLATGKDLHRIWDHAGTMALAFSADDKTLVADQHTEEPIVILDVATGKEVRCLRSAGRNDSPNCGDDAMAIALSADGKSLAVCWMSHTIELWDLRSGKQTLPLGKVTPAQHDQQSTDWLTFLTRPALTFSPDGRKLVCSLAGPTVRQFRVDTGAETPPTGSGHRAPVATLALSPDGKSLCTYSAGEAARCWDWITGKEKGQLEGPANATHAVFAADGRFGFAAGHNFTLCPLTQPSPPERRGQNRKTWKIAADNPVVALALSSDGALLATRNFIRPEVHLWDTTTLEERRVLGRAADEPNGGGATTETTGVLRPDLVFSPDGRILAGAGPSRQLCLWDTATGSVLWEVLPQAGQAIERFAFSPTGRFLATLNADRTVTLYEAASGAKCARLGEADPEHRRVYLTDGSWGPLYYVQMQHDAPVCLAFSPNDRYLATAQHTSEIHLWDVLAGREIGQLTGQEGGAVSLLFTPDGKHLISGGTDTTALTWDLTRLTRGEPGPAARLEPPTLGALWADLASKDATAAFDALRKLGASPNQAVALIKDRVRPASPPDPKRLAQLLADLGSDRFELRRQAESELQGLNELAEPALRKALADDPPLDLRKRLERLRDRLSGTLPSAEQMRELRATELLELIGNAEARQVLQTLAGGVRGARLTREASSSLQRLVSDASPKRAD
jgi:RNA polymerase sigma factor (sigma-70 family)